MGSSVDAVWFSHFPGLRLATPFDVLGGQLVQLTFDEFKSLDSDWARASYFQESGAVVWRRIGRVEDLSFSGLGVARANALKFFESLSRESEFETTCRRDSELIYLALVLSVGDAIPNPRDSVSYLRTASRVSRRIGRRDRTALLHGSHVVEIDATVGRSAQATAAGLRKDGFSLADAVFGPIRALALVESTDWPPTMTALPIMVALEALLLGERVSRITQTFVERASRLLPADPGTAELCREAYAWRSDLVHGRQLASRDHPKLAQQVRKLAVDVARAAFAALRKGGHSGNDLGALRRSLA